MDYLAGYALPTTHRQRAAAAVASLLKAFIDWKRLLPPPRTIAKPKPSVLSTLINMPFFLVGILLMLASISIFVIGALLPPPSLNEQLTVAAWDCLNRGNYPCAVDKSKESVVTFELQAIQIQDKLKAGNIPLPPTGIVSADDKRLILSRGVLNDVATCYLILGQAHEKQGNIPEAKSAYKAVQQFPHARAWDPKGFFWSPSEVAYAYLTRLP